MALTCRVSRTDEITYKTPQGECLGEWASPQQMTTYGCLVKGRHWARVLPEYISEIAQHHSGVNTIVIYAGLEGSRKLNEVRATAFTLRTGSFLALQPDYPTHASVPPTDTCRP